VTEAEHPWRPASLPTELLLPSTEKKCTFLKQSFLQEDLYSTGDPSTEIDLEEAYSSDHETLERQALRYEMNELIKEVSISACAYSKILLVLQL
jgi:hypothetical protein